MKPGKGRSYPEIIHHRKKIKVNNTLIAELVSEVIMHNAFTTEKGGTEQILELRNG